MQQHKLLCSSFGLAALASALLLLTQSAQAQSTPAGTKIEVLGTGNSALLLSPLTDPNNDGLDEAGGATDPSWDWADITASVEPDFEGGENAFNVFDHKVDAGGNDKWCCDDPTPDNPVWVAVKFKQVVSLTYFTVTSGNDTPDRDPIDWAIQGSNDANTWTDIYHFKGDTAPWVDRLEVDKFTLPAPSTAYSWIRYIAYDTPGTLHQVSEIEYFGIVGGATVVDTDKDGMPDDWEIKYGLNPNDPSDAAKDCNNNGITNLQEYQLGLDPCDVTPPAVVSTSANATFDAITLKWSEPLDASTATNLANYSISNLSITNVTYKGGAVTLSTAKQTPATAYTLNFKGIKDVSKNQVPAGYTATVNSYIMTTNGVMKLSYYGDATGGDPISGTPIDGLTSDPRYPASPDLVLPVWHFDSRDAFPDDTHENYGATIEGYLTPDATDKYTFFIRSDDASQLWLSTDATEAKLALVAEETGCCQAFLEPDPNQGGAWHDNGSGMGQTTLTPISLESGRHYFARLIYKEGGGGDYGQVAWRKAGDTNAASKLKPISAAFLSSTVALPAPPAPASGAGSTLTVKQSGKSLTISWAPTGGSLESTPAFATNTVWTAVGTANPATVTIGTGNSYYRVRQ